MSKYQVAVNIEWTGACNARCSMCPRDAMAQAQHMSEETYEQVLQRLDPKDVFRAVVAGYGDPTVHPDFMRFIEMTCSSKVPIDLVTNGERLDEMRLLAMDGVIGTLLISFSSIDPDIYNRVHAGLDQKRVMDNLILAQNTLRKTAVAVSLTPLAECIDTLPETINWLRSHGIDQLTMSPTLYDRAGSLEEGDPASDKLRSVIRRFGLHSQEYDFVPSITNVWRQYRANKFRCLPRNSDLAIAADGNYQYCFNDLGRRHPMGSVNELSVREVLELREPTSPDPALCEGCSTRTSYTPTEFLQATAGYIRMRIAS